MPEPTEANFDIGIQKLEPEKPREFPQTEVFMKALLKANFESRRYTENVQLIERQRTILSRLPENFIEEMKEHLKNAKAQQEKLHPNKRSNDFGIILGELFERFVEIEDDVYNLIPDRDPLNPETEEDKAAAKKILHVMQHPDEYGIRDIPLSNPDILRIKLVNGTYVINEDVEVKAHIDARTKRQLGKNGFKQSFDKIMDRLNRSDFRSNPKLSEFGIGGKQLYLSPKFFQNLVILRDQSISEDGIGRGGIEGRENMTDWEVKEFIKQLKNPEEVNVIRAAFGKKELVELTQLVVGQIYMDTIKPKN